MIKILRILSAGSHTPETLIFLWKMEVFKASGFKSISFPLENEGFPNSILQKHWFSSGKWKFSKLQASNTLVFLWKIWFFKASGFKIICFRLENQGFPNAILQTHWFSLGKWQFSKHQGFPLENEGFPSSRLQKHWFSFRKWRFRAGPGHTLIQQVHIMCPHHPMCILVSRAVWPSSHLHPIPNSLQRKKKQFPERSKEGESGVGWFGKIENHPSEIGRWVGHHPSVLRQ